MRNLIDFVSACRLRTAALVIAGVVLAVTASGAAAQTVVVLVNGEPITNLDIESRAKFHHIAENKSPSRQEVLNELIDERLKLQLTKRFDFTGLNLDGEVDNTIAKMAQRSRKTLAQFSQELSSLGIFSTLKSRVKAEMIWSQIVRLRYQASLQLNENDILKEIESRKKEDPEGFDYTLRPITFIVPRGSASTIFEARKREADGLRARFENCEEGLPFARQLRDVTVREQIVRSSADLPPALRDILDKTEVGRLTQPEVTLQGIELYALCAKKPSSKDNTPGKREVRDEIYSKQFQANARKFLKELRDQSYCSLPNGQILKGCVATSAASK
jgi:peptidyl-prolyl cis-trans isomerase SurA